MLSHTTKEVILSQDMRRMSVQPLQNMHLLNWAVMASIAGCMLQNDRSVTAEVAGIVSSLVF